MSFEIILLILLAALLHASWNAVIKGGSNKLYETGLNCFGGRRRRFVHRPFPPLSGAGKPQVPGRLLHRPIAYYLCIAVAYRNVDMSFAYTIHARHGPAPDVRFLAPFLAMKCRLPGGSASCACAPASLP